jgi:hypothetical protein
MVMSFRLVGSGDFAADGALAQGRVYEKKEY